MPTSDDVGYIRRLASDFEYYAPRVLKVKPKRGGRVIPFELNRAQLSIHKRLEEQKAAIGRVRALILKGRQQGASTYVQGRYYHRTSTRFGIKAFILAHEDKATQNLFAMTDGFYTNSPAELRPRLGAANANELVFEGLRSGYAVATAGSKDTGRSATAQLFHGSEVAFWKNAETHMMGIGQIVPNDPGTEIILESTANGVGNLFHNSWQLAEAGASDFIPIFTPWFWSLEYSEDPPPGYTFSTEDVEYQQMYGCTTAQLYWRRRKIDTDFQGDELRFAQEYPATAAEAFVNVGHRPFISVEAVLKARKAKGIEAFGARILGVDPARYGGARSAMVWRQGRVAYKMQTHQGLNTMQLASLVAQEIQGGRVDKVFIDAGGLGAGVVDRLHELGYQDIVVEVNFGEKATEPEKYLNKRAECWDGAMHWITDQVVQIVDSDELQADLVGPTHSYSSGTMRLAIETKESMEKRQVRSPDCGDALALTFAYPVSAVFDKSHPPVAQGYAPRRIQRKSSDWRVR
ncbi:MAG TPA: hypothetical protein PKV98_04520 [Burkholderiaceae bacterium]|nr:hypothetical protein [Burkholderiaceae bacterium]